MKNITSYEKPISRIEVFSYHAEDIVSWSSGKNIEIKPFQEDGGLWFVIIKNAEIIYRINAKFVSVIEY